MLAGALCRLLSEAWLRGSILVKSGEESMYGRWGLEQDNAYKTHTRSGSGQEKEDGEEVGEEETEIAGRQAVVS